MVSWEIYVVVFLSKIQVLILENKDEQLSFICEIRDKKLRSLYNFLSSMGLHLNIFMIFFCSLKCSDII